MSEKWLNKHSSFENDVYTICALAEGRKQSEIFTHLQSMIRKPVGVKICHHNDWVIQAHDDREEAIQEFIKKWGPKNEREMD